MIYLEVTEVTEQFAVEVEEFCCMSNRNSMLSVIHPEHSFRSRFGAKYGNQQCRCRIINRSLL